MLGLAQLGARLGVQLEAQLGIGWEIGIRGSAGLTYLGLVLGIGSGLVSAWKPGPARGSTNIICIPNAIFKVSKCHSCGELALFSPNILYFSNIFFFSEKYLARACSFTVD